MNNILIIIAFLITFGAYGAENTHYMQTKGEKIGSQITTIGSVLFGGLDVRGMSLRSLFSGTYKSWPKMERLIRDEVAKDECVSIIKCENYIEDFLKTTESNISYASEIKFLVDGPESFAKRRELLKSAKKSIKFITWAIYDDVTGLEFRDLILEQLKRSKELKVKIIVDGQVAKRDHHFGVLAELEEKGDGRVEVIRWRAKKYRANGNHRKMLVIDNEHLIADGMNVGDVYSHMAGDDLWRDTDIYLKGSVAQSATQIFNNVWNEQVKNNRKEKNKKLINEKLSLEKKSESDIPVTIVDHDSGTKKNKSDMNITKAMVKLIDEAEISINIENAYLILTSPVLYALKDAVKRGVEVKILTNSAKSVDEPVVAVPIQKSVELAYDFGAKLYLKKGSTLHSKFMTVDNRVAMIGSFNLHPRSHRYEGEVMVTVFDEKVTNDLNQIFERDLNEDKAIFIQAKEDIEYEDSFLAKIARTLFFDQL